MHESNHILFLGSKKKMQSASARFPEYTFHKFFSKYSFVASREYSRNYLKQKLREIDKLFSAYPISAVVFTRDVDAVLASFVNQKYDLLSPSKKSVFLCAHKYYTRQFTEGDFDEKMVLFSDLHELETVDYPAFIKPPYSALGRYAQLITDKSSAHQVMTRSRESVKQSDAPFRELYANDAIGDEFPLASLPGMLFEQPVTEFDNQVTVEGFVQNETVSHYAIVDSNLNSEGEFKSFTIPTKLSQKEKNRLFQKVEKDILSVGLNHTIFNAEYWIKNGKPVLIEINPRPAFSFAKIYKKGLGIDIYEYMVDLATGKKATLRSDDFVGTYAGQFNVISQTDGYAKDLFDFKAERPKSMRVLKKPTDYVQKQGQFGRNIARVNLYGDSADEINSRAQQIREKFLKNND